MIERSDAGQQDMIRLRQFLGARHGDGGNILPLVQRQKRPDVAQPVIDDVDQRITAR